MPRKGQRTPTPCVVCGNPAAEKYHKGEFKGYQDCCIEHRNWHRKPGPNHPCATKQGRIILDTGYVMILDPAKVEAKSGSRYIAEHRAVVEKRLGRKLLRSEIVHHANGIRGDNRDENLILLAPNEKHEPLTYIKALQAHIRKLEARLADLTLSLS